MLKLNYIFLDCLAQQEEKILKQNIEKKNDTEAGRIHVVCLTDTAAGKKDILMNQVDPATALLISSDGNLLKKMSGRGMATIGYVPFEETQTKDRKPDGGISADILVEGFEEVDWEFLVRVYQRKHNLPWTILETDRLFIRELTIEDLDDLFLLYEGEGMTDYMEPLYAYEQEKEYQKSYIEYMYRFYGYGMWLVFEKETGELVGRAGVEHREELDGELELGYAIGVPYRQRGYAKEACLGILAFVRDYLQVEKINCLIEPGNTVSEHLAGQLGFIFEKEIEAGGKRMKKYIRFFHF